MQTVRSRSTAALLAAVATAISFAAVSPAHAATADEPGFDQPRQTVVSLDGVVLSTPKGVALLDRRLRAAATQVCGPVDRELSRTVLRCRRVAIADAKARLNAGSVQQFARR